MSSAEGLSENSEATADNGGEAEGLVAQNPANEEEEAPDAIESAAKAILASDDWSRLVSEVSAIREARCMIKDQKINLIRCKVEAFNVNSINSLCHVLPSTIRTELGKIEDLPAEFIPKDPAIAKIADARAELPPGMNAKRFELFRDVIKHEDELMNNRLSWLIMSETFMMLGYLFDSHYS